LGLAQWQDGLPQRRYGCDRAGPQVAEVKELFKELGSIRFQSIEGVRHGFPF
jgi:hypothetical protein